MILLRTVCDSNWWNGTTIVVWKHQLVKMSAHNQPYNSDHTAFRLGTVTTGWYTLADEWQVNSTPDLYPGIRTRSQHLGILLSTTTRFPGKQKGIQYHAYHVGSAWRIAPLLAVSFLQPRFLFKSWLRGLRWHQFQFFPPGIFIFVSDSVGSRWRRSFPIGSASYEDVFSSR